VRCIFSIFLFLIMQSRSIWRFTLLGRIWISWKGSPTSIIIRLHFSAKIRQRSRNLSICSSANISFLWMLFRLLRWYWIWWFDLLPANQDRERKNIMHGNLERKLIYDIMKVSAYTMIYRKYEIRIAYFSGRWGRRSIRKGKKFENGCVN
jgi:hypothetical protein